MSQPIVASYCPQFLKKEMRHIYRQVTGLKRYGTFVITPERLNADTYPFPDIELLPRPESNVPRYIYLKFLRREEKLIYRGESDILQQVLERRNPALIHVYFGHTGVHLLPLLIRTPQPFLVSFHGVDAANRDERDYQKKMRSLFQAASLVLARSDSLSRRLVDLGCPENKIRLNRTSIPTADFPVQERSAPAKGEWRLVQACRLIEKKGLRTAIRAFADFTAMYSAAHFTIAGEGPMLGELIALAAQLGLKGRITFAGFQSQEDLRQLYNSSHIFLHPSETTSSHDQEGIPNSMLEAMCTGLPVIATRHGGIPEAVTDGQDGLLIAEGDVDALNASLLRLTTEPDLWQRLSTQAAASVREKFGIEAQIESLESSYDEAL